MKIIVASDTHGSNSYLIRALKEAGPVDWLLFAGDGERDLNQIGKKFPGLQIRAVAGNCDSYPVSPWEQLLEFGGKRLFLTHGHRYGVKRDLLRLILKGREIGADLIVFGHTHLPVITQEAGMLLLNPGSLSAYARKPSYGWIEIKPDGISPEIKYIHPV